MKLTAFQGKDEAGLLIDSQGVGKPICLERQGKTMMQFWPVVNIFAIKHGKISARKSGESREKSGKSRGKVPEKAGK